MTSTQFEAVRRRLAPDLQGMVTCAYVTGWRVPSEILTFQWRQVDLKAGTVRREPGTTKNKDGRMMRESSAKLALLETGREMVQDRVQAAESPQRQSS